MNFPPELVVKITSYLPSWEALRIGRLIGESVLILRTYPFNQPSLTEDFFDLLTPFEVRYLLQNPRIDPKELLVILSSFGKLEMIREVLQRSPVNDPSFQNSRLLREAAFGDQVDVVRYLLSFEEIDPSKAFHWQDVVNILFSSPIEMVRQLHQRGFLRNKGVGQEEILQALDFSCQDGILENFRYILEEDLFSQVESTSQLVRYRGYDSDSEDYYSYDEEEDLQIPPNQVYFNLAANCHQDRIMEYLMERDRLIDPSGERNNAIVATAWTGNSRLARRILRCPKVDPSVGENEPLRVAVREGHLEIVQLLLQHPRMERSIDRRRLRRGSFI